MKLSLYNLYVFLVVLLYHLFISSSKFFRLELKLLVIKTLLYMEVHFCCGELIILLLGLAFYCF